MVALPGGVSASNISLSQVLVLLDGPFKETADAIANGEYVLWLGSGISRDRVDDLWNICMRVLSHLWRGKTAETGAGPFTTALDRALTVAGLTPTEKEKLDLSKPPNEWIDIESLLRKLVNEYSALLGIVVQGKDDDYLLWEVVDVPGTYANENLEPDCEHLCVTILALEGLLSNVATANWDGLIEKAMVQLSEATPAILAVCVTKDDFVAGATRTRLLKFHGCAVRAKEAAAPYRGYLVGRASQIVGWGKNEHDKLMRHELVGLASTNPSLVVGLSVQDFNIKAVFSDGDDLKPHDFPSHPPAYVFAEQELGMDQEQLLQCVYGSKAYANQQAAINESAHIPAFAKPLLTALVLSTLTSKLVAYSRRADAAFGEADRVEVAAGILSLRDRIAKFGDGDRLTFVRALVDQSSKLLSAFRGRPVLATGKFVGLGVHPVSQISADPNLETTGLPELAAVMGLLGCVATDTWTIRIEGSGAIEINSGSSTRRLLLVASSDAAASLVADGTIDEADSETVVAICTAAAVRQKRNPSSTPGRVLNPDACSELAVRSILRTAPDAGTAIQLFREASGL